MTNDPTQPAPRPTTGLAWGIATHAGRVRDQNEDTGHARPWLFIVADGMGGRQAGEVASELTVTTITNACTPAPIGTAETPLAHPHLSDLEKSVVDANTAIFRASLDNPAQQGMGTTVTAPALIVDDTDPDTPHALGLANVGDSRTYLHRHNRPRQVTTDHLFVQELVEQGQITAFEARYHPRRNIVTRALGIEPDVRVDSWRLPLMRDDRSVLCSDGLVVAALENGGRGQKFPSASSLSIDLSSSASVSSFFNRAFLALSSLRRLASEAFTPPYWATQLCHVDGVVSRCRRTSSSWWPNANSRLPSANLRMI